MKKLYLLVLIVILSFGAKAQLIINEFSQGNQGNREYIELVVMGTRTCTDSVADLRGWIVDDQNGWYGGSGTGIAAGHLRFSNVANWQAVPYGSIILLYNGSDKNTSITQADDPTDANNDHVYIVPVTTTSTVVECNSSAPASPSSVSFTYPTTGYATANNDWTSRLGLANGGDAVITVSPAALGTPYHSVVYGLTVSSPYLTPNVLLGAVGSQKNAYLSGSNYNAVASWTIGNVTANETPGAANTTANATWINSMLATPVAGTGTITASICQGQSYTFNGIARTTSGSYLDTFTTAGGCDSIVTLNLTVNPAPSAPAATTPITYCQNATPTALTATGSSLLWYTGPTGGTGTTTAFTPSTASVGSTTYYVSQTVGGCESPRTAIVVNVNAIPSAPAVTTPITYCQNATPTALTATGSNLLWYTTATGGTGSTTAFTPSTTAAGNTTYYVSQTVSGCESPRAAIVVNVTAQPAAPTVTTPVTYCQNATPAALSATGSNLLWYTTATGGTGSTTPFTPSTTAAGSTTYYVSQTVSGCESPRAAIVVTVTATPAAPTVTTPVTYCQNATPTALSATGSNLLWYTTATGGTGSTTPFTPSTTAAGNTTYYVSQTVSGCESPRAAIVVNVTAQPAAPTVTTPVTYCQNATPAALSATGSNLLWYTTATGGTGNSTAFTPPTATAGSTTYYVSQTVSGCESPRAAIVVNVTAQPAAPTVTTPVTYCQNATPTALSATGSNLLWYTTATGGTGSTTAFTPSTTAAGNTTYYVSQTVSGCESPRAAIVVTVTATPAAPTVTTPVTYCQNATPTALNATGSNLLWYTTATGGTGSTTAFTPSTTAAGNTTYYVSQTVSGCESPRAAITVTVNAAPAAPAVTTPVTYCQNTTATALTATGSNLLWYTVATGGTGSTTAITPATTTAGSTTYYVSQTVSGCESPRAAIVVTINATPAAPAVTTPVTYCQNATPTALTATGSNLKWYTGPTGGTGVTTAFTPSTTTAGNTTYYVSQTVNGCESPRTAIVVTVTATPSAPAVTSPVTYCQNATPTALTATGSNLLWYTTATGGTGASTAFTPSTAAAGNTTYYVSQSVSGCESPRAAIVVSITATPAAPAVTSPVTYCQNATSTALSATGSNLLWYTAATGGTGSTTAPVPPTATAGSTTYYVSQTVSGCESPRTAIVVTVNAKPQPPATTNITYCQNQSVGPLTATGSNLLWYTTATGGTGNTTAPTPSTAVTGTTTWYVSQTVSGCESDRAALTVTISTTPSTPTVTSPVNLCENSGTFPLNTYVVGQNLVWYTTATGGTGTTTTPVANTAVTGTTTWYVAASAGICESGRAMLVVNINAKPAAPTATSPVTYCQYATPSPLSATGSNLLWYTAATGGTGSTTAITPNTINTGTTTYYVSQTVNGCESNRTPITVTVTTQPAAPAVTANYNYCQFNTPAPLTATGSNLKWYTTATGGTGTTTTPVVSTVAAGVYTFYVSQTISGCESPRAMITVTVNAKPAPPVTNTVHYCHADNAVPLTATGANLKWYTTSTGGAGSTAAPVPSTFYVGTVTYYVTQTVNGCESDRAAINVVVDEKVTAAISISKTTVCQYDTLSMSFAGGAPAGAAYNWALSGGTLVSGPGTGPLVVKWNTPGTKTVTMIVSNGYCIASASVTITVLPAPSADFNLPKDACVNELIHVQATDRGYTDYIWNFAGATIYGGGGAGVYLLSWSTPGDKIVTLNTVSGICKSVAHTDTIRVHDYPVAKIASVSKTDICSGDSVSLSAAVYADYKYEWSPASFFGQTNAAQTDAVVTFPGYLYLSVTDKYGCKAADSVLINAQPCCEVYLPNAFSPNGDGKNDVFRIITIGHHKISTFRVVNRWGQTVFETADERRGWDGTLNGTPQDVGTYYYYLKYKCNDGQDLEQKGEIILLR